MSALEPRVTIYPAGGDAQRGNPKGRSFMSDDEVTLGMSIPLDSDGFLRRECPTCEREFKWLQTSGETDEGTETADEGGYFCPYCGVQAPADTWLTGAQVALAQNIVATELVRPMLRKFGTYDEPERLDPLTEADDMTRVDFACHPSEPLKVLDDWRKVVRCLICGKLNALAAVVGWEMLDEHVHPCLRASD